MDFSFFIWSHHLGIWKTLVAQKVLLHSERPCREQRASHSLLAIYSAIWKQHMKVFCKIFYVENVNSTKGRCNADNGFRLVGGKLRCCPNLLPSLILTDGQRVEDQTHSKQKSKEFLTRIVEVGFKSNVFWRVAWKRATAAYLVSRLLCFDAKTKKLSQIIYQGHHRLSNRFQCHAAKGFEQDGRPAWRWHCLLCRLLNKRSVVPGSLGNKIAAEDVQ